MGLRILPGNVDNNTTEVLAFQFKFTVVSFRLALQSEESWLRNLLAKMRATRIEVVGSGRQHIRVLQRGMFENLKS